MLTEGEMPLLEVAADGGDSVLLVLCSSTSSLAFDNVGL